MIHEILTVGPLQCNCSILGDENSHEAIVVDPGDDIPRIMAVLAKVRGAAEPHIGQTQGFPIFDVKFNRDAIARYGLTMEDVADTVSAALGGRPAGLLLDGDRRFEIVVRVPASQRNDLEALGALPIMLPEVTGSPRRSVPLRQLASFGFSEGLNEINREHAAAGTELQMELTVEAVRQKVRATVRELPFFNPPRKTATPIT